MTREKCLHIAECAEHWSARLSAASASLFKLGCCLFLAGMMVLGVAFCSVLALAA